MASDLQVLPIPLIWITQSIHLQGHLCPLSLRAIKLRFSKTNKAGRNIRNTLTSLRVRDTNLPTKANNNLTIMLDTEISPRIISPTILHHHRHLRNRRALILHHLLQSNMLLALTTTHRSALHLFTAVMEHQYPVQLLQDPDIHSRFLQLSNTTRHPRPMRDPSLLHRVTYRHGLQDHRRHLEHPRVPVWVTNNTHRTNRMITLRDLDHNKAFKIVHLPPSKANKPSLPM